MKKRKPSPGSDAAIRGGCRCPVLDNARGRGWLGASGLYVFRLDCPLHFPKNEKPAAAEVNK